MSEAAKNTENVEVLVRPVMPAEFRQTEHELQRWLVYVDPKATDKQLQDPKFWSNVAYLLRVPAELTIWAEDGSWKKWATVHAADRNWAKVTVDYTFDYDTPFTKVDDPDMKYEWAGPHHKFRVVRIADGEVLSKDHQTKEQAAEWIRSHRAALQR